MPPFNQSWLLFTQSEVSEPHPLLWWASVLHPAENAAGCHGSSAGTGEGGARLQLRLPPDEHQHPGGELWPHGAHLHHHLCRTVLPRGNRPSPSPDVPQLTMMSCKWSIMRSPFSICVSWCGWQDPVYIDYHDWAEQTVCNGDWTYEVKHIEGCPVGVSYPVATNCKCAACNSGNTYCSRFNGDVPGCLPFWNAGIHVSALPLH